MAVPTVKLSSGYDMPMVGLGTFDLKPDSTAAAAVSASLQAGYRHFDTAWIYNTEATVGKTLNQKIRDGDVTREELFVTTKLFMTCADRVAEAARESLDDLGLTYIDLYLIHWPMAMTVTGDVRGSIGQPVAEIMKQLKPSDRDYVDTWRDMEKLVDEGLVRSIGVSNFNVHQLSRLLNTPGLRYRPVCNQIEIHPYHTNGELVECCHRTGVVPVSFSTLGRGGNYSDSRGTMTLLQDPVLTSLATKYDKTAAQVILRWCIQMNVAVIPKSSNPDRIRQNMQLFDFQLSGPDMAAISALNQNRRVWDISL
ncbi:aldo-keto reductase family 1 member B1-like [Littorina saxatilis]|uniref:aldo-keto reductase family 1 member B1-like n=1 Tax=Littorina saxatilis TaxID=31220 RepID=UPI0038B63F50